MVGFDTKHAHSAKLIFISTASNTTLFATIHVISCISLQDVGYKILKIIMLLPVALLDTVSCH